MAKNYDEENAGAVETFKTVKFGGYDKASVDYYIKILRLLTRKRLKSLRQMSTSSRRQFLVLRI